VDPIVREAEPRRRTIRISITSFEKEKDGREGTSTFLSPHPLPFSAASLSKSFSFSTIAVRLGAVRLGAVRQSLSQSSAQSLSPSLSRSPIAARTKYSPLGSKPP